MNCSVVIVAAGSSVRMGNTGNKLFVDICGKPLIAYSIEAFVNCPLVDEIVLVLKDEFKQFVSENVLKKYNYDKCISLVSGGYQRQHSVYNGLLASSCKSGLVLVHDGARPFVANSDIVNVLNEAAEFKAAVLAVPVSDTLKRCDYSFILNTVDRSSLWAVQTPQAFAFDYLLDAYERAWRDDFIATDDAALIERIGGKVKITTGSPLNIKITTPSDVVLAKAILNSASLSDNIVPSADSSVRSSSGSIDIYTDGACSHNPGKGGYGVVLLYDGKRLELSGGFKHTTNNRMEILAVIKALEVLDGKHSVRLFSDSKYVVDAIEKGWVKSWMKNNWKRSSGERALNVDLWQRLLPLLQMHSVKFTWVKGHSANKENERCDSLATSFIINGYLEDDVNYI